jgi:UDP-N-acetylmuramoyl-L-alanyl-D-glutamate--2,6-diaminopimelate ligase
MRLSALTKGLGLRPGSGDPEITLVTEDSRRVRPGALFVAVKGTAADGHQFVREALDRGAAAVIVERADAIPRSNVAHAVVPSGRSALALLSARYHGAPASRLRLIGFTGTFGKTTTSDILRSLLDAAGRKPSQIGSMGVRFDDFREAGEGLTTPSAPQLHQWLAEVVRRGARTAILEITSHALRLGRVEGLSLDGGLIAAIRPGEHIDFHHTYEDYVAAKRLFLDYLKADATLAFDSDNLAARQLGSSAPVRVRSELAIDGTETAAVRLTGVSLDDRGATFTVRGRYVEDEARVRSALLGRPNVRNVGLALAFALADGIPIAEARPALERLQPVRRRMERLDVAGRTVLDDTAGHPDSLHAVFEVVSMLRRENLHIAWALRGGRGAGINAANASALADLAAEHGAGEVIVTAADDEVEPKDRVKGEEADAVRRVLDARGSRYDYEETLAGAMRRVAARSRAGDLAVLVGAQGMNEGRRLLQQVLLDEEDPR